MIFCVSMEVAVETAKTSALYPEQDVQVSFKKSLVKVDTQAT